MSKRYPCNFLLGLMLLNMQTDTDNIETTYNNLNVHQRKILGKQKKR